MRSPAVACRMNIEPKKINNFKKWLHRHGAEILSPTNEYELLRFRCKVGTGIVYINKFGKTNISHEWVQNAYSCFIKNTKWSGKGVRTVARNSTSAKKHLLEKYGPICFYCGGDFDPNDLTQEHLLSALHNGPNRIENKALACANCNRRAGNLPLIDKILLRERLRMS